MPIEAVCPHCNARYKQLPEKIVGKTVPCRQCNKAFSVRPVGETSPGATSPGATSSDATSSDATSSDATSSDATARPAAPPATREEPVTQPIPVVSETQPISLHDLEMATRRPVTVKTAGQRPPTTEAIQIGEIPAAETAPAKKASPAATMEVPIQELLDQVRVPAQQKPPAVPVAEPAPTPEPTPAPAPPPADPEPSVLSELEGPTEELAVPATGETEPAPPAAPSPEPPSPEPPSPEPPSPEPPSPEPPSPEPPSPEPPSPEPPLPASPAPAEEPIMALEEPAAPAAPADDSAFPATAGPEPVVEPQEIGLADDIGSAPAMIFEPAVTPPPAQSAPEQAGLADEPWLEQAIPPPGELPEVPPAHGPAVELEMELEIPDLALPPQSQPVAQEEPGLADELELAPVTRVLDDLPGLAPPESSPSAPEMGLAAPDLAPPPPAPSVTDIPAAIPPPPATIDVVCPACGLTSRNAPTAMAGRTVKCRKCAHAFRIPALAAPAAPPGSPEAGAAPPPPASEPQQADVVAPPPPGTGVPPAGVFAAPPDEGALADDIFAPPPTAAPRSAPRSAPQPPPPGPGGGHQQPPAPVGPAKQSQGGVAPQPVPPARPVAPRALAAAAKGATKKQDRGVVPYLIIGACVLVVVVVVLWMLLRGSSPPEVAAVVPDPGPALPVAVATATVVPTPAPRSEPTEEAEATTSRAEVLSIVIEAQQAMAQGDLDQARQLIFRAAVLGKSEPGVTEVARKLVIRLVEDADRLDGRGRTEEAAEILKQARRIAVTLEFSSEEIDQKLSAIYDEASDHAIRPDDLPGLRAMIGQQVAVLLNDGEVKDGQVKSVTEKILTLNASRKVGTGEVAFTLEIPLSTIKKVTLR